MPGYVVNNISLKVGPSMKSFGCSIGLFVLDSLADSRRPASRGGFGRAEEGERAVESKTFDML